MATKFYWSSGHLVIPFTINHKSIHHIWSLIIYRPSKSSKLKILEMSVRLRELIILFNLSSIYYYVLINKFSHQTRFLSLIIYNILYFHIQYSLGMRVHLVAQNRSGEGGGGGGDGNQVLRFLARTHTRATHTHTHKQCIHIQILVYTPTFLVC